MVKKILAVLTLFICVGCGNGVKKVKVENFDYQKIKPISYVSDKHNQEIDEAYNVANKHFEYVPNEVGNCPVFNKVSESSQEETYLTTSHGNERMMNVGIFAKQGNGCNKIQSLDNVSALSNRKASYNNRAYINVISGEDEINKSGIWVLDSKNKKLLSKFRTMAADFSIDRQTGHLYTVEYPNDGDPYIREYDQSDRMVNQYKIKDEDYRKLFLRDGEIYLVSDKLVGEKDGDEIYNYVITMIPIANFFDDIKNKKYGEVIEIESKNSTFNTVKVKNDYMAFYGGNNIVCQISNWKCSKYENDTVELFDGQGYIGINGGKKDDEGMYLNKFGTYDAEKLLNYAQSYFTRQDGKDIYFQVFDRNSDDDSKAKTIKYTIK